MSDPTPAPTPASTPTPSPTPTPAPEASLLGREGEQQQEADPNAPPEWMQGLPDDLKGDKTLARFGSLEDLARGHVEAHKVAKSKVTLPKDDDPDSFARFAAAVRPETADSYEINLPEGSDSAFADAMRPVFHDAGLLPQQVSKLVEANNNYIAQQMEAANQKGADELDALKGEMGERDFERGKQAAVNMLNRLGIEPKFEEDMARFFGAGNTLRTLFAIAEKTGELGRVDATDVSLGLGSLKGDAAIAEVRRMQANPEIRKKLADPDSAESRRRAELIAASKKA